MPNESIPHPKAMASAPEAPLNPGDEAEPGTEGTGEGICPVCGGSGVLNGAPCAECGGSGKLIVGVGGG